MNILHAGTNCAFVRVTVTTTVMPERLRSVSGIQIDDWQFVPIGYWIPAKSTRE